MATLEDKHLISIPESSVGLRDYTRLKLELADIILALKQRAEQHNDDLKATQCRSLLARLAEDRFNLVVVGQFSRGKSSLMNAILGVDRLPTSVLPLTSVITTVSYGDRERVLIHWKWTSYPSEVPIKDLTEYVTQASNPENEKRVAVAEVQLPVELLRLGFYFIDTPGVGSAISANTATTTEFLPEADAVIFVTSFESPLSEAELQFLTQVRQQVRKIFLVVNKSDLVPIEERNSVVAFTRSRLQELFGDAPRIFAVSALNGLKAKQNGITEENALGGLPELESALIEFLKKDKAREFLRRLADRTADLLSRQALEIHIAQVLGNEREKAEQLDRELATQADQLRNDLQAVAQQWRTTIEFELPRRFESGLADLTRQLKTDLPPLISECLASLSAWDNSAGPDDPMKAIRDTTQERLGTWLTEQEQAIQQFLLGKVGVSLREFAGRVNASLAKIGAEAIGAASVSAEELQLDELLDDVRVVLRGIHINTLPLEPPWWLGVVPFWPSRKLILHRTVKKLDDFLSVCLDEIETVLRIAGRDWIDRLAKRLSEEIEIIVARRRETIRRKASPEEAAAVEQLRGNLDKVVVELSGSIVGGGTRQSAARAEENRIPRSDLRTPCLICVRAQAELLDFMRRRQYELHIRGPGQNAHAERGGFCALHTWQYEAVASPQGVCSAYPAVLATISQRLRSMGQWASSPLVLADLLEKAVAQPGACEACELISRVEQNAARKVIADLSRSSEPAKLPSLCIRHLTSVVRANPPMDIARLLVDEQSRVLERVGEEMQRYALKHEALKRHLATEQEQLAYEVGLSRLSSLRTLVEPWNVKEI